MISVIYVVIFVNLKSFIIKKIIFGNLLLLAFSTFVLMYTKVNFYLVIINGFLQIKENTLKNP